MKLVTWLFGLALALLAQFAGAVSVFDPITTAIDFSVVVAAIFAVAALFAAAYVTFRGVVWVIGMLRTRPRG